MNLGLYVTSLDANDQLDSAMQIIDHGIQNNIVDDISLFYNALGYASVTPQCGIFHATDLWNFHGNLLVYTLENIKNTINIINNQAIYYLYRKGAEKINTLNMIYVILKNNVNVIAVDQESANEIFRLTNKKALCILNNNPQIIYDIIGAT